MNAHIQVYSTLDAPHPPGTHTAGLIRQQALLAEHYRYTGVLLFDHLTSMEPWALAAYLIQETRQIIPLIATQPTSLPPHTAARFVLALTQLYQRRVDFNLIIGASPSERRAIHDTLTHDQRYERAGEYIEIIRRLLSEDTVSYTGTYYSVERLSIQERIAPALMPHIFVAGSSPAGFQLATRAGDVCVTHPGPWQQFSTQVLPQWQMAARHTELGVRVGIIARPSAAEAWETARRSFPQTRQGSISTLLKTSSESLWSSTLAKLALEQDVVDDVYWLGAFRSGLSHAPYLVGTYDQVARLLQQYVDAGVRHLILAVALSAQECEHIDRVLQHVVCP